MSCIFKNITQISPDQFCFVLFLTSMARIRHRTNQPSIENIKKVWGDIVPVS